MNKKAIYASYGIEYNNGKIFAPVFGWIKPLLIDGNAKLGKGIWTFSTLPTTQIYHVVVNGMSFDVKGTCPCSCVGCYATKGFYQMKSVVNSLAVKTLLCRDYLDFVKRAISAQIKADNIKFLRIHATVWALERCKEYGIKVPVKTLALYQNYIDYTKRRGERRGGSGYDALTLTQ